MLTEDGSALILILSLAARHSQIFFFREIGAPLPDLGKIAFFLKFRGILTNLKSSIPFSIRFLRRIIKCRRKFDAQFLIKERPLLCRPPLVAQLTSANYKSNIFTIVNQSQKLEDLNQEISNRLSLLENLIRNNKMDISCCCCSVKMN